MFCFLWKNIQIWNPWIICYYCFQSPVCVQLFATPWTAACQACLSFTVSLSLFKLTSIESAMPPKHLILCWPFSSCPRCFPTSWLLPTSWLISLGGASASASVLPMNIKGWYPVDWLEWSLEVQGALKSLLKHDSLKASIFNAQPSLWSNSHIYTRLLEKP